MQKTIVSFLATFFLTTALVAGPPIEQRPVSPNMPGITQQPQGGFSNNIAGLWNCGSFGKMKLNNTGGNQYTGEYKFVRQSDNQTVTGKVKGTVKKKRFQGTWRQPQRAGEFNFRLSIQRKTTRPTHMKGQWRYTGENKWQRSKWNCVRE